MEKTFVPLLSIVPIELNQSAPFSIITGTLTSVSTLLTTVGRPKSPLVAGYGGFALGLPLFPSILLIKAVSSPQT